MSTKHANECPLCDLAVERGNAFGMTAKGRAWLVQACGEEPVSGLANAFELADLAEEDGLSVVRTDAQMAPRKPVRAEWFADGTPATCTCGHTDCDHVLSAQTFAKVRGSVSAVWEE
jgi:hypothetical protein